MPNPNILDKVKLYYLGGLPETGNPLLISKGATFTVPPVGGYIELPRFHAEDLIRRNEVVNPNGRFSVFTLDSRAAQRAAAGPQKPVMAQTRELTREELLAMIADLDAAKEAEEIVDPNEPVVPPTPSAKESKAKDKAKVPAQADEQENK